MHYSSYRRTDFEPRFDASSLQFAELSEQGRPTAVFFVNGVSEDFNLSLLVSFRLLILLFLGPQATALVASSILLFVRLPPAKHIVLA